MRTFRKLLVAFALAGGLLGSSTGCHHRGSSHVSGGVLGRVVIYRNGVAFYERNAMVENGKLTVRVPRERVDDFLKSLTIVDRVTKKPLAITIPRSQDEGGSFLAMTLEVPGTERAEVLLTYVTEAPAWKPSYRVVVGQDGKVMLESWAVVDNTSSEDWNGVLVGVGASSALAFRYDLWSVRSIDRDLLAGEERFAIAPPTGVSPYSDTNGAEELVALSGQEVKPTAGADKAASQDGYGVSFSGSTSLDNNYSVDGTARPTGTTGVIQGVVTDIKSGEKLAGVTVVATSTALKDAQTAITDEQGAYTIGNLPKGNYVITMYYGEITLERAGITVAQNRITSVSQKIDPQKLGGEVIRITASAPIIEMSTVQGITVNQEYIKNIPTPGRTFEGSLGAAAGSSSRASRTTRVGGGYGDRFGGFEHVGQGTGDNGEAARKETPAAPVKDERYKAIVAKVQKDKREVVIVVHGQPGSETQALGRGQTVKNRLVDEGVPAAKIHIVPKLGAGEPDTIRVLAVTANGIKAQEALAAKPASKIAPGDSPVGESHFIAERPMTIRAGSSAMVAMVHGETSGGVVYLYDPVSDRGDQRFAFKAVRLDNPTGDTLEPGPVTVYGEGRFIGEGITEPVPPHAAAVVPFALDKQIVVEKTGAESDQIAKLVTVQRGIVTAEVQHRRETKFAVTSRLTAPTTVYLRHKLAGGWSLVAHPEKFTRVGDSHLFEIRLAPGETQHVTIAEATPVERTFDLTSDAALGMMKVFVDEPNASPELKRHIEQLLATHKGGIDLEDKIQTLRDQLVEYRSRSGELHAQLITLKAVKTGGELMQTLKAKLAEMSDRTQKATIAIVETQEKLMLQRVKFQNQLAELKLTDVTAKEVSRK